MTDKKQARLERVEALICAHARPSDIARQISASHSVSKRQVQMDIAYVYAQMESDADEETRQTRRGRFRMSLAMIFAKAIEVSDFRAALSALDRIGRLDNVYQQTEQTGAAAEAGTRISEVLEAIQDAA